MNKESQKYSHYQIKRAMSKKVVQVSDNTYLVNDKNIVINNKKNFRCDCKWVCDNKNHIKYCSCILSVLHCIDKESFWSEIFVKGLKSKKVINVKEKDSLTDEGLINESVS